MLAIDLKARIITYSRIDCNIIDIDNALYKGLLV